MITLELDDDTAINLMTQLNRQIGAALQKRLSPAADEVKSPIRRSKLTRRIVAEHLGQFANKPFHIDELQKRSGLGKGQVSAEVARLAKEGKLSRVSKGSYKIAA